LCKSEGLKKVILDQRCPSNSPLATCDEWPFEGGDDFFPNISKSACFEQNLGPYLKFPTLI